MTDTRDYKPYRGEISHWKKIHFSLGYVIFGRPSGHPSFTNWIRTSVVVKHEGDMVETLNSRYKLIGPEDELG